MNKNKVLFERRENNQWLAFLEQNPDIEALGKTKVEAIGRLYILHADRVGFIVGKASDEDEESSVEIQQLYVEQKEDKE